MAQHDYNIANQGFPAFRTDLNNALSAIQTTNSGTSRPTGAVAGQLWLDTTTATSPTLKYYDGADDISLATIDHTTNTVNWLDSTVSITGLTTTATGTVLTLSDSANTTTVNLILDNQKEIRFRETTANGTNYVALKAPASVSADLTFTLPATDGTVGQVLQTNGSGVLSFATVGGLAWQSVQTTGFTAVASRGYPCNTTSSAFTVTLPASPSGGDTIVLVDYAGTFATNAITLGANSNKINGVVANKVLTTNRESVTLTYVDSTQGWVSTSGSSEGMQSIDPTTYSAHFLVIAGGGGGSSNRASGGGGAGGYRTSYGTSGGGASAESTLTLDKGIVYTVTIGAGGAGASSAVNGTSGSNTSISGTGITTITSTGGGGGGNNTGGAGSGSSGGSGGGNGGTGTANQGYNGGAGDFTNSFEGGGGGGGSGAIGGNGSSRQGGAGGNGVASSITGSSVTRAGGGGGGCSQEGSNTSSGGSGGGGGGTAGPVSGTAGTVNTGSGGGGAGQDGGGVGGAGGKGVLILRIATSNYSGTTTGSPTVTTDGSDKVIVFNDSGSITG